jgi:hypothetical protein
MTAATTAPMSAPVNSLRAIGPRIGGVYPARRSEAADVADNEAFATIMKHRTTVAAVAVAVCLMTLR